MFDMMTRVYSPYQFNPFNLNPLRRILEAAVDFDALHDCQSTKLFLSTTNVRTGKVRVFRTEEITADVVMASACLPFLFHAVKIGEDHYWDGGYMGNPALFPLFYHTGSRDVLVIHINPIERDEVPVRSADILNRLNEITFNASLLKEMRAIAFVTKLIEEDWIKEEHRHKLKHLIMHSIRADGVLCDLSVASKFNTDWHFLLYLRDLGRDIAGQWLEENFESIGSRSTVNVRSEFLEAGTDHAG
jgi:NTE family protein